MKLHGQRYRANRNVVETAPSLLSCLEEKQEGLVEALHILKTGRYLGVLVHDESSLIWWLRFGFHLKKHGETRSFWKALKAWTSLLRWGHVLVSGHGSCQQKLITLKWRRVCSVPALSQHRNGHEGIFPSTLANSPNATLQQHSEWHFLQFLPFKLLCF